MDLVALQILAAELAREAGRLTQEMRTEAVQDADTKSSATDMVTKADKAAEVLITEGIRAARPDDAILGEEGTNTQGFSGITWHIDPIDGTTNYIYGLPYAISIGVAYQNNLIVGAVYAPQSDELFIAADGSGATCNDQPLHCNNSDSLTKALVATGFSYIPEKRVEQSKVVAKNISKFRDIRRIGSAALDLCFVAAGRVDAYYERHVNIWDIAAGVVIAREAGAVVTDISGDEPLTGSILAAGVNIHTQLLTLLND